MAKGKPPRRSRTPTSKLILNKQLRQTLARERAQNWVKSKKFRANAARTMRESARHVASSEAAYKAARARVARGRFWGAAATVAAGVAAYRYRSASLKRKSGGGKRSAG